MRVAILSVALLILGVLISVQTNGDTPAAEASFHEMRIYGLMGGKGDTASAQFIELRMAAGGQNQVQNAQICFYDADGVPWARFVFPSKVDVSAAQSSVLVGSGAMSAEWQAGGATPDFIFGAANTTALNVNADVNAPIHVPAGAIVYESKTDIACGSPNPIDAISYGTGYNGAAFFGDALDADLPITDSQGFQLKETPVVFPPSDNSTEYELVQCIVARNNAGASGPIGGDCGPSATATAAPTATPVITATPVLTASPSGTAQATPTPTIPIDIPQGDADCSGHVDEDDAIAILGEAAGLGDPPCPERADVDCENGLNVFDALRLFKHLANIRSAIAGCTPIGEPLPT